MPNIYSSDYSVLIISNIPSDYRNALYSWEVTYSTSFLYDPHTATIAFGKVLDTFSVKNKEHYEPKNWLYNIF